MDFKKEKYVKLILYIISHCTHKENLGKTVISILIYFIDFNYYELYGESLTNEVYLKSRARIVPKHFNEVLHQLTESHHLYYRQEVYYYYLIKRYYIIKIPLFNFTQRELEVIDYVIYELSDFSATELMIYQRGDVPYKLVNIDEELDYNHVFYRDEFYSVRKY
ncbi:MAG: DUF4065 domain-containing protein [Methanobrevibacter sp.]|nr:DUF4065 domain-containing protein [Methanobrevibacter sp.]